MTSEENTWSRGTNQKLPFAEVILNISEKSFEKLVGSEWLKIGPYFSRSIKHFDNV